MGDVSVKWLLDAVRAVAYEYERFSEAKTPLEAAGSLVELNNAMHDLVTYLPEYDLNTGWLKVEES